MQLRELTDGTFFRIVRTGQTAIKLGVWGNKKIWRAVQFLGKTSLSAMNHQVEVEPLSMNKEQAA